MATITASSRGIDAAVPAYVPQPLPGPQPPVDRTLGWAAPTATRPRLSATGSGQGLNGNIATKGKAAAYKIKHTNVLLKVDAKGPIMVGQDADKETMNRANLFVRIRVIRSSSSFSLIGNAQLNGIGSQPDRDRRHPVSSRDYRYFVAPSGYRVRLFMDSRLIEGDGGP